MLKRNELLKNNSEMSFYKDVSSKNNCFDNIFIINNLVSLYLAFFASESYNNKQPNKKFYDSHRWFLW